MKKSILIIIGIVIISVFLGAEVSHAYTIPEEYTPINDPLGTAIQEDEWHPTQLAILVLQIFAGALLYFAAPLAVVILALAGFNLVMGGADSEKIETAKKHITWTVLGLILIILSYVMVRTVIGLAISASELGAAPGEQQEESTEGESSSGGGAQE